MAPFLQLESFQRHNRLIYLLPGPDRRPPPRFEFFSCLSPPVNKHGKHVPSSWRWLVFVPSLAFRSSFLRPPPLCRAACLLRLCQASPPLCCLCDVVPYQEDSPAVCLISLLNASPIRTPFLFCCCSLLPSFWVLHVRKS